MGFITIRAGPARDTPRMYLARMPLDWYTSNICATMSTSSQLVTMLRVVDPFSNGPCVLALSVREVLEVLMTTGTIKKVVADRGFGFISGDDAKEYFFHRNSLDTSLDFDRLAGGEKVEFEIEQSPKGPRASKVQAASGVPAAI